MHSGVVALFISKLIGLDLRNRKRVAGVYISVIMHEGINVGRIGEKRTRDACLNTKEV